MDIDHNGRALFELAQSYRYGCGVDKSIQTFLSYLAQAVAAKDVRAMTLSGQLYLKGQYFPQNTQQAIDCFKKASKYGFAPAAYQLACFYSAEENDEVCLQQAFSTYKKVTGEMLDDTVIKAKIKLGTMLIEQEVPDNVKNDPAAQSAILADLNMIFFQKSQLHIF